MNPRGGGGGGENVAEGFFYSVHSLRVLLKT